MRNKDRASAAPEVAEPLEPEAPASEFTVAVTPAQLAAGAAVLAGLILFVAARRRGRNRDRAAGDRVAGDED